MREKLCIQKTPGLAIDLGTVEKLKQAKLPSDKDFSLFTFRFYFHSLLPSDQRYQKYKQFP